jgi:hypothetical protein
MAVGEKFMANKHTFSLLLVAVITSIGLHLAPAYAATPGTWVLAAENFTLELEVNSAGTGITQVLLSIKESTRTLGNEWAA